MRMKWLKIAGVVVLISIIIGIVVLVTLPYRMSREIDARIAAIKAQGDPVSGKDLIPHVPDSQNGAVIYEKVFKITEPGRKDIDKACNILISPKLRNDPEQLKFVRKIAAKYRSALPLIKQATLKSHCRFDVNWSGPVEKIDYTYLKKMKNVAYLLFAIAVVDSADGKTEESLNAVEMGYQLSESLSEEPTLLPCLTRYSLITAASRALRRSTQYANISDTQARRLFDLLGKSDLRYSYVNALKGERAEWVNFMECVKAYGFDFRHKSIATSKLKDGPQGSVTGFFLINSVMNVDELCFITHMNQLIKNADQPYNIFVSRLSKYKTAIPRYTIMSKLLLPVINISKTKYYESMETINGDRSFLAVLAYKSRFGVYPSSLDDLEKKLGWKLPSDPMSSQLFRYRGEGKGFILYGLGRDMKDDNAKTIKDLPDRIKNAKPRDSRYKAFLEKYPYSDGNGRRSADMIWGKSR